MLNGAKEVTFGSFDGRKGFEHYSLSCMQISTSFVIQDTFFFGTEPFTEYIVLDWVTVFISIITHTACHMM